MRWLTPRLPRCQARRPARAIPSRVDRVGSTGFVQLEADSFHQSQARASKPSPIGLSQASIAINPIIYDQASRFGLRQKRVLEIDRCASQRRRSRRLTPRFSLSPNSSGPIAAITTKPPRRSSCRTLRSTSFAPPVSRRCRHGAGGFTEAAFEKELDELKPSLFDPNFEPHDHRQEPPGRPRYPAGQREQLLLRRQRWPISRTFTERYPLNSRLAKVNGQLVEQVYRAGTPDHRIPPGLYAEYCARQRVSGKGGRCRRAGAGQGDSRSDPLLPDRRSEGLARVRHRLGAEQRDRRFRQRLHRSLSRRARRQGHFAKLRYRHRQHPWPP